MDANAEPSTFASNPDIAALGGLLVTPTGGTCRYRETWATLDYFLIDRRLGPCLQRVYAVDSWHAYPHRPVCLELGMGARALRARTLAAPRRFPPVPPSAARAARTAAGTTPSAPLVQMSATADAWLAWRPSSRAASTSRGRTPGPTAGERAGRAIAGPPLLPARDKRGGLARGPSPPAPGRCSG